MSSLFTVAEIALATLGLAELSDTDLDVVVGGLGLGYTACAVLDDARVTSLLVVEAIEEVIRWHEHRLLPDVVALCADPRTRLQHGDFFAMAESAVGFDPTMPQRRFDAILLDVDHTPRHVLHPSHAAFYTPAGLRRLSCSSSARRGIRVVVRRSTRLGFPRCPGRGVRHRPGSGCSLPQPDHRRRLREHGIHRQVAAPISTEPFIRVTPTHTIADASSSVRLRMSSWLASRCRVDRRS